MFATRSVLHSYDLNRHSEYERNNNDLQEIKTMLHQIIQMLNNVNYYIVQQNTTSNNTSDKAVTNYNEIYSDIWDKDINSAIQSEHSFHEEVQSESSSLRESSK